MPARGLHNHSRPGSTIDMAARRLALAALPLAALAAPAGDAVTNLPGFGPVLSDTYSGYLDAGNGKKLHYIFTAALANPSTAKTVIWFNGGPGCSSLDGLFSESGLYHIQEFSNPPTLYQNPFSWANVTNQVFLEVRLTLSTGRGVRRGVRRLL